MSSSFKGINKSTLLLEVLNGKKRFPGILAISQRMSQSEVLLVRSLNKLTEDVKTLSEHIVRMEQMTEWLIAKKVDAMDDPQVLS